MNETLQDLIGKTTQQDVAEQERIRELARMSMNAYRPLPMNPEVQQAIKEKLDAAKQRQVGGDHYKNMGVEPWDVIDTWPIEQQIGYHRGNVLKYTMRLGNKDERLQEAKKIRHYADKLIEVLERTYGSDTRSEGKG